MKTSKTKIIVTNNGCVYGTLLAQNLIEIQTLKYSKMGNTKNEQQCAIHDVMCSGYVVSFNVSQLCPGGQLNE